MEVGIRDAIVGYLQPLFSAAYPTVALVIDNGPFDWANPPPLFAEMTIEFLAGEQVNLSDEPKRRVSGFVYFTVRCRQGKGTRELLQMLEWFSSALQFKSLSGTTFRVAQPEGSREPPGWYMRTAKVEFLSSAG